MRKTDFHSLTRGCFTMDDIRGIVKDHASTDENGDPLPVEEQEDSDVQNAMDFLAEVEKQGVGSDATFYGQECDWEDEAREIAHYKDVNINAFPFNHIDWEAAGQELADECCILEWDGETFLYRD